VVWLELLDFKKSPIKKFTAAAERVPRGATRDPLLFPGAKVGSRVVEDRVNKCTWLRECSKTCTVLYSV
jgi:hypothetical protein